MTSTNRRRAGAGMAAGASVIVAASLYAQPATGPWAKVPALPTACYVSQEQDNSMPRSPSLATR